MRDDVRSVAFVGREPELDALRAELRTVEEGRARIALLIGAAGIGKSTLVERFLAGTDAVVLRASGDESETELPLGVIDQLLRRAGAAALGPAEPDHLSAGLRLLDALGELEAEGPVIVAVDDAHWADPLSLRALLFAARRLVADRVLILLAAREDGSERLPAGLRTAPNGTSLRLEPLGAAELRTLAAEHGIELSARAAQRLQSHTGGNPLHATALLHELPAERWDESGDSWPAPRSFSALVRARVEACDADARGLVEAVAVLGMSCPLDVAASIADCEDPLEAVGAATEAGLLRFEERDGVRILCFPHPLGRAAVYHAMRASTRARLHTRAAAVSRSPAAAFRHRVAAAPVADATLADELEAFAAGERARAAWSVAATSLAAASRLSPDRADRERRLFDAAEACLYAGDTASARHLIRQVETLPPGPRRDSVLAYAAIEDGRAPEAEALLASACERCDAALEPALAATIAERRAHLAFARMRPSASVEWGRRAAALANGSDLAIALSTWTLALGLDQLGRTGEAHAVLDAAIDRLSPALRAGGMPLADIRGALLLFADRLGEAHEQLATAAPLVLRHGSLVVASITYGWLARTEYGQGAWDDAVIHADRALALAVEADDRWAQVHARWIAMLVPAARGALAEVEEHARAVAAVPVALENHVANARLSAAQSAAAHGDAERVREVLEPLRDAPLDPGPRPWQGLYADALLDLGALEAAEAFLDEHEPDVAGRARPAMRAQLARARGRLYAARKQRVDAEAAFTAALAAIEPLGMPFEHARVRVEFGQFLRRDGQRRAAAALLTAAREQLEALAAAPLLERCNRELEACGLTPVPRKGRAERDPLTPRERAVARLAASGLTNREIAAELMLSVKTVERHLTHAFAKRGVRSRAQLREDE